MFLRKWKILNFFIILNFLFVFSSNWFVLEAQPTKKVGTNFDNYDIDVNKYKERTLKARVGEKTHKIKDYIDNDIGIEFSAIEDASEKKQRDEEFKYAHVYIFIKDETDIGIIHALEHLITEGMIKDLQNVFKNDYTPLSADRSNVFFNAVTHKNFLEIKIDNRFFNEDSIKIISKYLLNPIFLKDNNKLFRKEARRSKKNW